MAEKANVSTKEKGKVLIVDDVPVNRFVLSNIISEMEYKPLTAENGLQALDIIREYKPALVLLDVAMPEMDGYELTKILKDDPETKDIPIIFISAYDDAEDVVKGFKLGGQDYVVKPFVPDVVKARVGVHLQFYENKKELQETNRRLQASLANQRRELEEEKMSVIHAMANLARKNSLYGEGYIERMTFNCRILTQALQIADTHPDIITDEFIETIECAAPLMDIGNVAVAKMILEKNTDLTPKDRDYIKNHTKVGKKILSDLAEEKDYGGYISMASEIAACHHENWDGSGYPEGLKGDEIPLSAQIASIISVYCALTSDRGYREAYPKEEALLIIELIQETRFDPKIYKVFMMIANQLK